MLRAALPASGVVLEIASGTGEHAVHFARHLPALTWQPSDVDDGALASTSAWVTEAELPNLKHPLRLDVAAAPRESRSFDAIVCINMLHIAPWSAAEGLFKRAAQELPANGPIVIYGPMKRSGVETAPSNVAFDESLRARSPAWGLRRLEDIEMLARAAGFGPPQLTVMPANNVTVVFRKS